MSREGAKEGRRPMDTSVEARNASTRARRDIASLPGPTSWPLVGNLLQVDSERMHATLESWAVKYGPLYRFDMGRRQTLVVARTDLIAQILRDRPDGWRRLQSMQEIIREMGSHGLFSAEGDDWRRQRKLVMAAFDPGHLKRYFPALVRVTERLLKRLHSAADRGEVLDLQSLLMRYTVDVTAGLAFGVDVNTQEQPDDPLQAHLDKVFPMLMKRIFAPFPWWRFMKLPSDRAFDRHLAQVHEAVGGFVQAARARIDQNMELLQRPTNLLEALIAARDEDGGGLSDEAIAGNVMTVLLGGEDTTANTLSWTLHLLHTHRSAWDEVVRRVDDVLGTESLPSTFEVARNFEYIERCVSEAMRLHPVAPLFLFERNSDTTLEDIAVPAGATVICVPRSGAVDTKTMPDAQEFRPERWDPATNKAVGAHDSSSRDALKASTPFGAGPRLCPGRYLAMLEMKMVLATVAKNFELIEVATENGSPPKERLAFTMFPIGLRLRIAPRRDRARAV
jgi:cytochrome P450